MTSNFIIKIKNIIDTLFKSYQSQFFCIFNDYAIRKYGNVIHVTNQYYLPSRIEPKVSLRCLMIFSMFLTRVTNVLATSKNYNHQIVRIQSGISRLSHPALDSRILTQFFAYMATIYNFNKMLFKMRQTIIYNMLLYRPKHDRKYFSTQNQVRGIEIALHGRIPREPVRPRKTVQLKTLGTSSSRRINKNIFILNKAEGVNPELGTFTFWARLII